MLNRVRLFYRRVHDVIGLLRGCFFRRLLGGSTLLVVRWAVRCAARPVLPVGLLFGRCFRRLHGIVGCAVFCLLGRWVGCSVRCAVGCSVGSSVGCLVGWRRSPPWPAASRSPWPIVVGYSTIQSIVFSISKPVRCIRGPTVTLFMTLIQYPYIYVSCYSTPLERKACAKTWENRIHEDSSFNTLTNVLLCCVDAPRETI